MALIEVPALAVPRTVLITGGSGGIGRASAVRLAELGARIAVGYNSRRDAADGIVAGLHGTGHLAIRIAVEDAASIAEARSTLETHFGFLDALINSGGATTPVPANDLDALTDEIFDHALTLNLRGPFAVIRAMRPLLERGRGGAIVNVSSIAARTGIGSSLAYLAAKGGLDSLTIALAKVLAPKIRVFSISPAGVDTDFVPSRTREQLERTAEKFPLARVTEPDDVARAIVACIVNLTSSTGIVLPVDEGRHL